MGGGTCTGGGGTDEGSALAVTTSAAARARLAAAECPERSGHTCRCSLPTETRVPLEGSTVQANEGTPDALNS